MNFRHLMTCLAGIFLAATLSPAQTATCTNWKTFNLPSPWIRTLADGINKYSTVVGYTYDPGQNTEGFIITRTAHSSCTKRRIPPELN